MEDNALFPPERIMRYAVYTFRGVTEDGLAFTRSFIVLKNGCNVIVRFTRYQEYAGIYERGSYRPVTADPEAKLHFICKMLNHTLAEHGGEFGINHIFSVARPMPEHFFSSYAQEKQPDGTFREQASAERCASVVTAFAGRLCAEFPDRMKVSKENLFTGKFLSKTGEKESSGFSNRGLCATGRPFSGYARQSYGNSAAAGVSLRRRHRFWHLSAGVRRTPGRRGLQRPPGAQSVGPRHSFCGGRRQRRQSGN